MGTRVGFGASSYLNEVELADAVYRNYELVRTVIFEHEKAQASYRGGPESQLEFVKKFIAKNGEVWERHMRNQGDSAYAHFYAEMANVCLDVTALEYKFKPLMSLYPRMLRIVREVDSSPRYGKSRSMFEKRYGVTLTKPKTGKK